MKPYPQSIMYGPSPVSLAFSGDHTGAITVTAGDTIRLSIEEARAVMHGLQVLLGGWDDEPYD